MASAGILHDAQPAVLREREERVHVAGQVPRSASARWRACAA
jgi:hypothetical protein